MNLTEMLQLAVQKGDIITTVDHNYRAASNGWSNVPAHLAQRLDNGQPVTVYASQVVSVLRDGFPVWAR
jgi:hypothetical protein